MTPPDVVAAGAAVWRVGANGAAETLLVHRPRYDDWSLPKGKQNRGEHITATAVREVAEETGLEVSLGRPLGEHRYQLMTKGGTVAEKRVTYWAAAAGDAGRFQPSAEVDDIAWLPLDQARKRLTWARDGVVLDALEAAPMSTTPILLLRHAMSFGRDEWEGVDDEQRPLSPRGEEQAIHLRAVIGAYGVRRVVSSPSIRCLATVQPFAAAAGIAIETAYALTERGGELDVSLAVATFAELLGGAVPALLCTHRPLLPALVRLVSDRAVGLTELPDGPLEKGEVLVAHVAQVADPAALMVVAAERHPT